MAIQQRWYQDEAVDQTWEYLCNTKAGNNPLIAMPTGTGKSVVINRIVKKFMFEWPSTRIIMATHVKELVAQNAASLQRMWPAAPLGIHSASLGRRDTQLPIIFGGVQSMVNKVDELGPRHVLIIDEAHLLPHKKEAQYQQLICGLKQRYEKLRIIGLTATPYRTGDGTIHGPGKIFTDLSYDLTSVEQFNRLIAERFLAPLIPRPTKTRLDYSEVKIVAGEYEKGGLEKALDKEKITHAAMLECIELGADRASWLVFASGVNHAEHITDKLNSLCVSAVCVHGKLSPEVRDFRINAYKMGHVRAIVNFNVLTTGFDDPKTDMIVMLRPTKSPGLWVQMLGRGTRPFFEGGKLNCLVLDFARNTENLGPINDPVIPKTKKAGKSSASVIVPIKVCTSLNTVDVQYAKKKKGCGALNHIQARFCVDCGNEFLQLVKIEAEASTLALIRDNDPINAEPIIKRYSVLYAYYSAHSPKSGGATCLKAIYNVNEQIKPIVEYVQIESQSNAVRFTAGQWWAQRHPSEMPSNVVEALRFNKELRKPNFIEVWENHPSGYPTIMRYEY